jgi:hypothetical protein
MNFRNELTILKLEPEGDMTVIESAASDGTIVVIRARVVEPLRVGDRMALTLTAQPAATAAGPSMRERMQARVQESALGGPTPRLSVTLNNLGGTPASGSSPSSAAPAGNVSAAGRAVAPASAGATSAPIGAAAPQSQGALGDASSMLLSSILGASPRGSASQERNVDDEMDALLGARGKG